jgi:drug/metabolite transporter (DMT)-like permease
MNGLQIGELAAVATALLWTLSTLAWTSAGRRVGSLAVSFLRLLITCVFLSVFGGLFRDRWLPTDADGSTWLLLGVSGLAGFFASDLCAFRSLLLIGPRLTLLVQSLAPPLAAIISWVFLGEILTRWHWLAMAVTLSGMTWVIAERPETKDERQPRPNLRLGLPLAVCGALLHAIGMVLARKGIGDYDAVAATFVRVLGALPGYFVFITLVGRWPVVFRAFQHGRAMGIIFAGSVVGPFLGVTTCMIALRTCPTGVVTTIVSTMPVLVLPFSVLLYHEHVSLRAAAGAVLSVLGVALMCSVAGDVRPSRPLGPPPVNRTQPDHFQRDHAPDPHAGNLPARIEDRIPPRGLCFPFRNAIIQRVWHAAMAPHVGVRPRRVRLCLEFDPWIVQRATWPIRDAGARMSVSSRSWRRLAASCSVSIWA